VAQGVYGAIARDGYLRDMESDQFAARLGEHWGEVNVLHAFREGNTRSQRAFFSQLADQAGYTLDGTYLEQRYREFNTTREIAMLSGDSTQFGSFLRGAVQRREDQSSIRSEWQARVVHLLDTSFSEPSSEVTRSLPPTSHILGKPRPEQHQDRATGIGD
jgi:hypothetical protein